MRHPKYVRAIDGFLRGCKRHGVIPGNWVNTVEEARRWARRGARFLTYGADFLMVLQQSRQALSALRPQRRSNGQHAR
jgi:2-keto-3-deoxy-L-rhamnonate aldolase RhmA